MRMFSIRPSTVVIALAGLLAGCGYLAPGRLSGGVSVSEGRVVFRYFAPSARRVQLGSDWPENNWAQGDGSVGEANIGLMHDDDADGVWELTVDLPAGRYRYAFWVDELFWDTDRGNPEEVQGGPTGTCSLLVLQRTGDKVVIR